MADPLDIQQLSERAAARPEPSLEETVLRLRHRCEREKSARLQAEALLEEKSLDLLKANAALKELNHDLETAISARTEELQKALKSAHDARLNFKKSALHDPLTGLPNRRYLREKLDELVAKTTSESGLAVIHVDLDRFKLINDTIGHAAGDFVLTSVAEILRRLTDKNAFVARIGGDEFVIVTPFRGSVAPARELACAVVRRTSEPVQFESNQLRFGASVGVAHALGPHVNPGQLLVNADLALYRAKEGGRGRVEIFTEELEAQTRARKQLADELSVALERREFIPYYHPRINARTGRIDCVEALARWRHPTRGLLAPYAFLSIADDIGATAALDDMILGGALVDLERWRAAGVRIPRISVNVSLARLADPHLLTKLEKHQLPEAGLSFELLESIFLDDPDEQLMSNINRLKAKGISLEIDDFGSGHASIIGVVKIQPSAIKIDRRLVADILVDERQAGLVKAIVDIGASVGAEVVAEGVETPEHIAVCTRLGCASLQGYAFARPMSAEDMAAFATRL